MTDVTSLELSKRLADVSGWEAEYVHAGQSSDSLLPSFLVKSNNEELGHDIYRIAPAYDSGFLLRQLPRTVYDDYSDCSGTFGFWQDSNWTAGYVLEEDGFLYIGEAEVEASASADTPENALAELCLALFEAGVLKK